MDEELLKKALNNDKNELFINIDTKKITNIKNNILYELELPKSKIKSIKSKLKNYRYIDNYNELHFGNYIRWINIRNPEKINLTNGGIICEIKSSNDDIYITCKNNINRIFRLKMSETIIFQKITNEEHVLLKVMDFLNK